MSVNLSPRQLQSPELVDEVRAAIHHYRLEPGTLVLEITENVLMQANAKRLEELKDLDVGLAIDDFGTGYSSLSYLDRFPIDVIKVDRSFVQRLADGPEAPPLVKAILQIGEALGMQTVVEGIETSEQLAALRRLGCRTGQGYYFAPPLDAHSIDTLLLAQEQRRRSTAGFAGRSHLRIVG